MRLVSLAGPPSGERIVRFETTDCRSLDGSIAFLIATAVDPTLGGQGIPEELNWIDDDESWPAAESLRRDLTEHPSSKPAAPTTRAPEPPPRARSPQPAPSQATADLPRPWQLGVAALGGNGPNADLAVGLMLDLSRTLTTRLAIATQLSGETALSSRELGSGRSVIAQRFAGAVLACLQLPLPSSLELRACGGPELSGVLAHGSGFQSNRSTFVVGGGGLVRVDLLRDIGDAWTLGAGVLLHAELGRPHVTYERADSSFEAFRVTPWQLQVLFGVAYKF
jgi:hypothetical protein